MTEQPQWDDETADKAPSSGQTASPPAPLLGEIQLDLTPFPYQLQGIKFLYDRAGALLGDQPGLGKTAQSILAARLLLRDGKIKQVLIICPKTIIGTWQDEMKRWWPGEKILVCRKDKCGFLRSSFKIKLCHYDVISRMPLEFLKSLSPHDLVICDEVSRIKNSHTSTARAVKALPASRRWALTGTPIENRIEDLASIMGFCVPQDVPHEVSVFQLTPDRGPPYVTTVLETVVAPLCHSIAVAQPEDAKRLVAPYMLRRRQEDVLSELPEKFEQDVELDLLPPQRETYDRAEEDGVMKLNAMGDEITITHIFQLIAKLRQICNFDSVTEASCKIVRLCEDLTEIREAGRKTLVFSQFVGDYGLKKIARYLPAPLMIHGEVAAEDRMAAARQFNDCSGSRELLLNYKCGGLGLNLQGASYVFLFDRWWNPAVEDQAIKRCHRIGQKNKVIARKFVCRDTIEQRILQKIASKRHLASQVLDGQPVESCSLTQEELFQLFRLKVRPKKKATTPDPVEPTVG